jgi:hypothetical protein
LVSSAFSSALTFSFIVSGVARVRMLNLSVPSTMVSDLRIDPSSAIEVPVSASRGERIGFSCCPGAPPAFSDIAFPSLNSL